MGRYSLTTLARQVHRERMFLFLWFVLAFVSTTFVGATVVALAVERFQRKNWQADSRPKPVLRPLRDGTDASRSLRA
jgi:hypothetical protein